MGHFHFYNSEGICEACNAVARPERCGCQAVSLADGSPHGLGVMAVMCARHTRSFADWWEKRD